MEIYIDADGTVTFADLPAELMPVLESLQSPVVAAHCPIEPVSDVRKPETDRG